MKYKKMMVWSTGSKSAMTEKIKIMLYSISFIMFFNLYIKTFIFNLDSISLEYIMFGIIDICLLGLVVALIIWRIKKLYRSIKNNKLICIYLYKIEEFAKIGKIPEDKFVLFSDKKGIVLAEKKFKEESIAFSHGNKNFNNFEKYYDKYAVEKNEFLKERIKQI